MTTTSIPVYILTGYLGAGKTTLLKTLLRHIKAEGRTPAVLMNEFGSESVDTLLLQNSAVPVMDLLEGCVCCTLRGSLSITLQQMVVQYKPNVIFLETTGVASPVDLVEALVEPELADLMHLAGIYTLVSAKRFPLDLSPDSLDANERTMIQQVQYADAILVSKTDLVKPEHWEALQKVLQELNGDAPLLQVYKGEVDAVELLGVRTTPKEKPSAKPKGISRRTVGQVKATTRERTSFGNLQTFTYEFEGAVDKEKFFDFLRALPDNVLRAKGFYKDAEHGMLHEFHYEPGAPMSAIVDVDGNGRAFAVFIGKDLDEAGIIEQLQECKKD
ncbi:G3E family GTPase [Tumebacillus sp. BK434]|uniref:CobW family GTP-binding protein n=1 Tax=Tumebacillus sp. BK434 TaxID=2512169 RepID=UPI0010484CC4|nr:GTP-binding protein [Tumebacillus sp. BK434]TCP54633.1 G3E family GTPase [Tumebacillus sp. BK434]